MKKLIYSTLLVLATSFCFSQNNSANNETINNGRVIGSYGLGSQEVTTIMDETTDCIRKTSPHSKGLFLPNETVEIVLKENKQMAEVRKSLLTKKVYANKNCGSGQQDCLTSLCIIKNNDDKLIFKYTDDNYKVFYNASRKTNNSIKSSLIIYGGNNGNGAIPTSYYLDKSNSEQFKLFSHKGVIEESDKLLNQNGVHISGDEEVLLEKLILEIKNSESELTESDLAKNIFYHTAIIKTVKRAIENNESDCNCAPVPLYFTDKTPFLCQQDLAYNVNQSLESLKSNSSVIAEKYDSLTIERVKSYLERRSTEVDYIFFEESYIALSNGVPTNEFIEIIDDHIELAGCLLGQGSDLGCCGNYSGCCWFWSVDCLNHDLGCAAIACDHWTCGWACEPL